MSPTSAPLPAGVSTAVRRTFGTHPFHTDGELLALAFAPDGKLWSVEEAGALRCWDVAGRRQTVWHALDEPATLWAFSRDARRVAVGSDELSVWDVASGRMEVSWPQPSWVTALAFPPAGAAGTIILATGHDDGAVRLWDASGRVVSTLAGHEGPVSALAFGPHGRQLASAAEDRIIRLWDVARGAPAGQLVGHTDRVPTLAFSPDGNRLYSAGWDTTARVWDLATCEPIILLNSHAAQVLTLALSPDGLLLACADSANRVHLWDTARHRTLHVLPEQTGEVRSLAFSPDGQRLASGGAERVIHLWDARHGADQEGTFDPLLSRTGLAVSPDGRRLLSLGAGTTLRSWEVATGEPAGGLEGDPVLRTFAVSPDGRWVAASTARPGERAGIGLPGEASRFPPARDTLGLWEAGSGRKHATLEGQAAPITALAFAPNGQTLAAGGLHSDDVWLWRIPDGEPLLLIPGAAEGCSVEAIAFHPAGRVVAVGGIDWLATSGFDGRVVLWDVADRRRLHIFRGGARGLAFDPSGRRLAVVPPGQTIRLWDLDQGRILTELIGHLDAVNGVAFSPDGRWLASGGDDRTVRLWDAATGLQRASAELDTQVKAIAFAPDGLSLFTGNANASCFQLDVRELLAE